MRILVATDQWFPDVLGGVARVAAETARRLAARGHEVTVLAPAGPGAPAKEVDDGLIVLRCVRRGALPKTVSDFLASRRLASRRNDDYELLVGHQVTTAAGLAAARTGLPLVLVYHASAVRESRLRYQGIPYGPRRAYGIALGSLLGRLERVAVSRARRVLVLSEYKRSLVARDHPRAAKRVCVARGGVDLTRFTPDPAPDNARETLGFSSEETLILAVRRLERGLGLESLLRAFGIVVRSREATLVLVGNGSLAPRLRALGAELDLGDRLRLVGRQDEETLSRWYRAADLFVLPPNPLEGFGMATVEALASGTPVVAARVGANSEILEPLEPRLVARSDAPFDIAAAMVAALELAGSDLRRRCREYAVARFAWDHVILEWEEVLVDAARPAG